MPYARPQPVRSSATPTSPTENVLDGLQNTDTGTLATPWSADDAARQLEDMRLQAATPVSPRSSPNPLPESRDPAQPSFPTPSRFSSTSVGMGTWTPSFANSPAHQSETSTPASQGTLSRKQRLFQLSDDEEENLQQSADEDASTASRVPRSDPIRRSMSALSGVTVIGKGHSKDTSASSLNLSGRPSLDAEAGSTHLRAATAPQFETSFNNLPSEAQAAQSETPQMDFSAALNLLSQYPREGEQHLAGPVNLPTISTEVDTTTDAAVLTGGSPLQPGLPSLPSPSACSSTSHTSTRRHSRSSFRDRERPSLLSPLSPCEAPFSGSSLYQPSSEALSPLAASHADYPGREDSSQVFRRISPTRHLQSESLEGASKPLDRGTLSRRSSKASDNDGQPGDYFSPSFSRSASAAELSQVMRSFKRPIRAQTALTIAEERLDSSTESMPLARSMRSNASNADLKMLIQQRRRLASAPFSTTASVPSSGAQSPVLPSGAQSPLTDKGASDVQLSRRIRSRRNTAVTLGPGGIDPLSPVLDSFDQERLRALRGMSTVVMTPSIEEWRQLGLHEDVSGESEDSDSDDSQDSPQSSYGQLAPGSNTLGLDLDDRPRLGSITTVNSFYGAVPPSDSGTSELDHHDLHPPNRYYSRDDDAFSTGPSSSPSNSALDDEIADIQPPRKSTKAPPKLSRQSLSVPGSSRPKVTVDATSEIGRAATPVHPLRASNSGGSYPSPTAQAPSPVSLTAPGPVDPRCYSAVTGARNINSFVVASDAGKGAYGLVRKVREKGRDGRPTGPYLMLKYIIKQRILADAYKRHKVLGAIPTEIHVLDYIRRVYKPDPNAIFDSDTPTVGHPNICAMLDFFEDAENYYLVMPCIGTGRDLFDYVDEYPTGLSLPEARHTLRQIIEALSFLHANGIVHRDIKDENVILDGKGGVQLIDFGSAAYVKEGKPYFDTFSGTLDFASPEVLRGERYGGKETDIWALGVLAFVVVIGECPFWSAEDSLKGLTIGFRPEVSLQTRIQQVRQACSTEEWETSGREILDAVDFIHQCLHLRQRHRPSADELLQHRFLKGASGWSGFHGWDPNFDETQDENDEDEEEEKEIRRRW